MYKGQNCYLSKVNSDNDININEFYRRRICIIQYVISQISLSLKFLQYLY